MKLDELEELGALIAKARKKKGWLQDDLAEAAGVSQQLVSKIEQGKIGRLESIKTVASAAGLEVTLAVEPYNEETE